MGEARRRRKHCAYCGELATSRDHVPPQSLFIGDRTNLLTVPSCDQHNGKRSGLDERFREFVSLALGGATPRTKEMWDVMARGVRKNNRRQKEIAGKSRFLPDLGVYAIEADVPAFQESIEQITRGLYWHCYSDRLPLDTKIDARLMQYGDWVVPFVSDMAKAIVGGDQFFYAYKRMDEHPTVSVWVFVFHRRLVGMALTDISLADRIEAELKGSKVVSKEVE